MYILPKCAKKKKCNRTCIFSPNVQTQDIDTQKSKAVIVKLVILGLPL